MSNTAYSDDPIESYAADEADRAEHGMADEATNVQPEGAADSDRARPVPRISIQAFCEDSHTAEAVQVAAEDRRLSKAHVSAHMGGVAAAVAHYQEAPTPNLIVIESRQDKERMLEELDQLAEVCDSGTKVLVIGHINDPHARVTAATRFGANTSRVRARFRNEIRKRKLQSVTR